MELHQLRYFVAVAELGNFTRAAERCGVSQPALSQQIIKLELELKRPLFDRSGRKARLTEAGEQLLGGARTVLSDMDALEQQLSRLTDDGDGSLTVGVIPTVAPYLFPALLRRFAAANPRVGVTLQEDPTARVLEGCSAGDLDLGVMARPVTDDRLHAEDLFRDELLVALPAGHPLAAKKALTLADLSSEPFVLLSEAHCLGEQVFAFCRRKDFHPPVRCTSAQLLTVQELVGLGHGLSLVPAMAVDAGGPSKCVYRPMAGERPFRTLALVWRKGRYQSRSVRRFIDFLRDDAETRK
jgi:LysR family hydrogen peroxide-inducible transcriptional activator